MKKKITGIILTTMLLALPACTQHGKPDLTIISPPSAAIITPQEPTQESAGVSLANLILDESVDLTAKFEAALPVLTVKYKPFNAEKVLAVLMPDANMKDMTSTRCVFINGMAYDEISRITENAYISIDYKISYRTGNGEFYEKYSPKVKTDTTCKENGELPFKSSVSALDDVKSILARIGIENVSLKEAYAMDYKTLEAMEREYSQREGFDAELRAGREVYKGDWSGNDDCYFFVLRQELNGIPAYEDNYLVSESDFICGTEICVYYTKNGIESLSTEVIYELVSSQTEAKLVSAEDALMLIDAKYADIILLSEATITRMELMYIPTSGKETTEMVPAWRFTLVQYVTWKSDVGMITNKEEYDYYFSAIDGTELLCER